MRRFFIALCVAATAAVAPVSAQSIDPGMNREQVMGRLGPVVAERSVGPRSYLFYRNGCEIDCGTHDIVILENGIVVDAIFRAPYRRYTGKSSSPVALPAKGDSLPAPVAPESKGGFVTGAAVIAIPTSAPPGISVSKDTIVKRDTTATPKGPVSEGGVKSASDTMRFKGRAIPPDTARRKP